MDDGDTKKCPEDVKTGIKESAENKGNHAEGKDNVVKDVINHVPTIKDTKIEKENKENIKEKSSMNTQSSDNKNLDDKVIPVEVTPIMKVSNPPEINSIKTPKDGKKQIENVTETKIECKKESIPDSSSKINDKGTNKEGDKIISPNEETLSKKDSNPIENGKDQAANLKEVVLDMIQDVKNTTNEEIKKDDKEQEMKSKENGGKN
ncbi:hypothetical protein SK128_016128 [Halocaridina rubra]|uniref:Uncharacterized protein n=1 Tax=Halocaridina rubra TaxID=373956 RepID=A0AAN9A4V5_HALRR